MKINANLDYRFEPERYEISLTFPAETMAANEPRFLCFSMAHPIDEAALIGGVLVERQGDWHRVQLNAPLQGQFRVVISGSTKLIKATDLPQGLYLQGSKGFVDIQTPDLTARNLVEKAPLKAGDAQFIPMPNQQNHADVVNWPAEINLQGAWNADWLQRLLSRLSTDLVVSEGPAAWSVKQLHDGALSDDFKLSIRPEEVCLLYKNESGRRAGEAYCFQYFLQLAVAGQMNAVTLTGQPRFAYRGVHLDVVRHFFAVDDILQWLDLFALLQFNYFHWHLTDDDGWRLQSQAFPELTETGAWRGAQQVLPPQMGTGYQRYGGFYNAEQAKAVVNHAAQLAIEVVPEMDLPGHARAFLKSLPQLVEPEDQSQYRSVQHHNDNVINPALPMTNEVLFKLIDEWCEIFPGKLFHIGADEVPKGVWQGSPAAKAWQDSQQAELSQLQAQWIQSVEHYLNAKGKRMAGWEEVREGGGASSDCWVYSWQGVEAGLEAAQQGHSVVMTPAQHCYFDLAMNANFAEPGYWWAGTLDVAQTYHYQPSKNFAGAAERIAGVQYCLWSELISTPQQAEFMWFPRLFAGAQVAWGGNTNEAYCAFQQASEQWSKLFAHLGIAVRSD